MLTSIYDKDWNLVVQVEGTPGEAVQQLTIVTDNEGTRIARKIHTFTTLNHAPYLEYLIKWPELESTAVQPCSADSTQPTAPSVTPPSHASEQPTNTAGVG